MLEALKNLYRTTKVFFDGVDEFESTSGTRQGASSSAYLFIIFINGLFKHLRDKFDESAIYGLIHCLIHADDTLIIDETLSFINRYHEKIPVHIVSGSDQDELRYICQRINIERYFMTIEGSPTSKID